MKEYPERIRLLGVDVDSLSEKETEERLESILKGPPLQKMIVTLNPEIILRASRDPEYRRVLNESDLSLCDGFGVMIAACCKGKKLKKRYTGVDLTDYLLRIAKKREQKVLVITAWNALSSPREIKEHVRSKFDLDIQVISETEKQLMEGEQARVAEIIILNFGSPRQEMFIQKHRKKFKDAKILVGVGGTFDFLTGKMKRAPGWMRKIGLEWLWRLAQEPKRIKRIFNAVFVFPAAVIFKKNI